jgi:hypothetical protein
MAVPLERELLTAACQNNPCVDCIRNREPCTPPGGE